ncbi:Uncharacterised protein [Vibrio cholerae]|nr:Uncharacterised protein [Vibrio cholerae]
MTLECINNPRRIRSVAHSNDQIAPPLLMTNSPNG